MRIAVASAFLPICIVVGTGITIGIIDARHMHRDLQRMFEELREVSLSRSLLDELHGAQQWVDADPDALPVSHRLIYGDLRHHIDAAAQTFEKFAIANDPSASDHDSEEQQALVRVEQALVGMRALLSSERPAGEFREPLGLAMHGAGVLSSTVQRESRAVGDRLDRRARRLSEFLILFGVAAVVVMSWLAVLLLRRVLVPVRALRRAAEELGRGRLDTGLSVRHNDELGDLAEAFTTMATQLRQSRGELELRVEERSREVLRSARLAELGSVAAGIAHEINTPLASIAACAEGLLREGPSGRERDESALQEYLEIIRKEAMRTRDITARLLRFARHDTGRREHVRLGEEVREVAPLFAHQLRNAGVELVFEGDRHGPVILGDAAEWRQVFFNLLRNALDASPSGTRITVRCGSSGGRALLEVADQGGGIRAEDIDRVFEPFFTTKAPGKGTGLGLSIVHRIVTGHDGEISVENVGGGAVFRLSIPAETGLT